MCVPHAAWVGIGNVAPLVSVETRLCWLSLFNLESSLGQISGRAKTGMKGVGQMFCNWVEPSGLIKATRDCQTLPFLPSMGCCTVALVPRDLDTGWMLLALSKLPRNLLFPSLSNYAAFLRLFTKETVRTPPGIKEKQTKGVSSGLGADNQAQNPEMSGTGDTRK